MVYVANLIGAGVFAWFIVLIGPTLGIIAPQIFGEIAGPLIEHSWWVILLSAILAGWLMGLLSWLVAAGRDTISQVLFVWLTTAAIGFGHFHHSIVGTVEVLTGVFAVPGVGIGDYAHFLLWTTLGNGIGGTVFVALLKYSHVVRGGDQPDDVDIDSPAPAEGGDGQGDGQVKTDERQEAGAR